MAPAIRQRAVTFKSLFLQADITAEFERLRSKGVNPGKAMWQATTSANKKKVARDAARKQASRGEFAASAMAMFKDADSGDGQAGADGVVRSISSL